jgi:hypothetical protein
MANPVTLSNFLQGGLARCVLLFESLRQHNCNRWSMHLCLVQYGRNMPASLRIEACITRYMCDSLLSVAWLSADLMQVST